MYITYNNGLTSPNSNTIILRRWYFYIRFFGSIVFRLSPYLRHNYKIFFNFLPTVKRYSGIFMSILMRGNFLELISIIQIYFYRIIYGVF